MKHKIIYLSLLLTAILAGCAKQFPVAPIPSGTFAGQFTRIRLNANGKLDTAFANLQLSVQPTTGFAITGDTTIHAGSHGDYQFSTGFAVFADVTFPHTGTPAKVHLSGTYEYSYDGTNFQIIGSSDSLGVIYNLKKTN